VIRPILVWLSAAPLVVAQVPPNFEEKVRAAMAASLEKQRSSIQKQATAAPASTATQSSSFFTVPWPGNVTLAPSEPICDPMPVEKLNPLIEQAAKREDVKADLVRALIEKESAYRPCAVSVKGAQGLMQLMPDTAAQFEVFDPFDPKQNIDAGTKFLKQLLTKYNGDVSLALSAYNAGPHRVDRDGGIPAIRETMDYVSDILAKLPKWR